MARCLLWSYLCDNYMLSYHWAMNYVLLFSNDDLLWFYFSAMILCDLALAKTVVIAGKDSLHLSYFASNLYWQHLYVCGCSSHILCKFTSNTICWSLNYVPNWHRCTCLCWRRKYHSYHFFCQKTYGEGFFTFLISLPFYVLLFERS